jgi:hypothetical protein
MIRKNIQYLNIRRENDVIHLIVKCVGHLTFADDRMLEYEMVAKSDNQI